MKEYDLTVIGSGAGLNLVGPAASKGWRVALIEAGQLGGTCLNRGCIPSKMWIYPADVIQKNEDISRIGVLRSTESSNFPLIRSRTREIVRHDREHIEEAIKSDQRISYFNTSAYFIGDRALKVGDESIRSSRIVVAAGARTCIPEISGLNEIKYLTSETVFDEMDDIPKKLLIVGGGYKGCEFSHFFSAMGTEVVLVQHDDMLLPSEEPEISSTVNAVLGKHARIYTSFDVISIEKDAGTTAARLRDRRTGNITMESFNAILLATGVRSNADRLNLGSAGVTLNSDGYVRVNEFLETTAPGVWALGDITGKHMFRHTANRESQIVWNNMASTNKVRTDEHAIPHAIYTAPTIGGVGLTEKDAAKMGIDYLVGTSKYSDVAKGVAMGDDQGLVKVIVQKGTDVIIGAHIVGDQADLLVQQITLMMSAFDGTFHPLFQSQIIHPSLSEVLVHAFADLHSPAGRP